MRALALNFEDRRLEEIEASDPEVRDEDDVIFEVLEVGVCGTDRALARFQLGYPPAGSRHLVLGHETLGRVMRDGGGFSAGDLVVPTVRRGCEPPCRCCGSGRRDLCITGRYTERGIMGAHGYFCDVAVDRGRDLIAVPAAAREFAILVEPMSVVQKAIRLALAAHVGMPERALVIGAGPIGILTALALQLRGIEVSVESLEPPGDPRVSLLREAGIGYGEFDTGDLVFEAAGAPAAGYRAAAALRPCGVAMILGAKNGPGAFPFRDLILKNGTVIGVVNASIEDFAAGCRDLASLPLAGRLIRRVARGDWHRTIESNEFDAPKLVHALH